MTDITNGIMRKPEWLRVRPFAGEGYSKVAHLLESKQLRTVCQDANCPNRGECFNDGTATFLIMGPLCTRNCSFCDIPTGRPAPLDPDEPKHLAEAARQLDLKHVVVTSVTRDDLPDGGAGHFAETVRLLRETIEGVTVELLTPDFRNCPTAVDIIIDCHPDVFNHNIETVPRLYSKVRAGADYRRSMNLLREIGERSDMVTKSGLMVGVGETKSELVQVFNDLAGVGVSVLTIGQYLQPSSKHLKVVRFVTPEEFDELAVLAKQAGLAIVVSGPLVRSSYRAADFLPAS